MSPRQACASNSTKASTAAGQNKLYDSQVFSQWLNAYDAGNSDLAAVYERRFRAEFRPAFNAWIATDPLHNPSAPAGPTFMPEYVSSDQQKADQLETEAAAAYAVGVDAQETGDAYVLNTVFLASALFLAGVAGRFRVALSPHRRSGDVGRGPRDRPDQRGATAAALTAGRGRATSGRGLRSAYRSSGPAGGTPRARSRSSSRVPTQPLVHKFGPTGHASRRKESLAVHIRSIHLPDGRVFAGVIAGVFIGVVGVGAVTASPAAPAAAPAAVTAVRPALTQSLATTATSATSAAPAGAPATIIAAAPTAAPVAAAAKPNPLRLAVLKALVKSNYRVTVSATNATGTKDILYVRGSLALASGSVTVTLPDGSTQVFTTNSTTVVRDQGKTESLSDLESGERAMVFGLRNTDGTYTAKLIRCVRDAKAPKANSGASPAP